MSASDPAKLELAGALIAWQSRAKRDPQSVHLADTLWRAACFEATAIERWADGNRAAAERMAMRAAEILTSEPRNSI